MPITESQVNERRKLIVADTEEEAIAFTCKEIIRIARQAIAERGRFCMALSGGSTPKKLYEAFCRDSDAISLDWTKVFLFWSDERGVKPDHPDSNYAMAMNYFGQAPFNQAKILRMQAELVDIEKAASEYGSLINHHCPNGQFDVMLLGVGTDGHTASLFPNSSALIENIKYCVGQWVPEKKMNRLTVTFACINNSKNIFVLLFGADKALILNKVLYGPDLHYALPAQRIGTTEHPAVFIVDKPAASRIASAKAAISKTTTPSKSP